jgi:hypothetical protein
MPKTNTNVKRMGSDPLSWIKDSRDSAVADGAVNSNPSKHSKHRKPKLPSNQDNPGNQSKPMSTRAGLKIGWTRATFIIREEHGENIKALAYWDRREIKDLLDEALTEFLKGKEIKPIPRKRAD